MKLRPMGWAVAREFVRLDGSRVEGVKAHALVPWTENRVRAACGFNPAGGWGGVERTAEATGRAACFHCRHATELPPRLPSEPSGD